MVNDMSSFSIGFFVPAIAGTLPFPSELRLPGRLQQWPNSSPVRSRTANHASTAQLVRCTANG